MIHQQRVSCLSHAVTERAVGKWCQRLPLAFVLQEDMLSKLKWRWCHVTRVTFWVIIIG